MAGIIALASIVLTSINPDPVYRANAETKSYGITFDSTKNKLHNYDDGKAHDGEAFVKTDLGSSVGFSYCKLKSADEGWHSLLPEGYFCNTVPIHGVRSVSVVFESEIVDCNITFSYDTSFSNSNGFCCYTAKGMKHIFDFNGYNPNYFKITNSSNYDLLISSVSVSFSCLNNYPNITVLSENAEMGYVDQTEIKKTGSVVTINAHAHPGYRFLGWYSENVLVSANPAYTFTIGNDDIRYIARFTYESYDLIVKSESSEKGTVSDSSGQYDYLTKISVTADSKPGYLFYGWYCGTALVSKKSSFIFTMPSRDCELFALFLSEQDFKWQNALKPRLLDGGNYVFYGLYPQTNVSDPDILESLNKIAIPESNGWYLYDGEYYAKSISSVDYYPDDYRFDNGITIKNNYEYWYKCQPISWDVLNNSNGEYRLVSSDLLDGRYYKPEFSDTDNYPYDSNYEYSDIRKWLNNDFYNNAFFLGDKNIVTTLVNNSLSTTWVDADFGEGIACADTKDKVYFLSYKDYLNVEYGFNGDVYSSNSRRCLTTDWTRTMCEVSGNAFYCGNYWTRSPSNRFAACVVSCIGSIGGLTSVQIACVRPAIKIKF